MPFAFGRCNGVVTGARSCITCLIARAASPHARPASGNGRSAQQLMLAAYRQHRRTTGCLFSPTIQRLTPTLSWTPVSYTHLRAHETDSYLVCRLLLEKKNTN